MPDTYSTYPNQNLELKYRLRCFFSRKCWPSSMDIALNGRFFANHNKKSIGQNRYHVVNYKPDENNNVGLVYTELMKKVTLSLKSNCSKSLQVFSKNLMKIKFSYGSITMPLITSKSLEINEQTSASHVVP